VTETRASPSISTSGEALPRHPNRRTAPSDAAHHSSALPSSDAAPPLTLWARTSLGAVYLVLSALLALLSLDGLYRFGRAFGTLEYLINFKRRRRFAAAYESVAGPEATPRRRRHATRAYFMQTRCDKMFYLIHDRLSAERARSLYAIQHREVLDAAMQRGRGVYVAVSHQGPHHVAGALLALHGYPVVGVRDRNESALRRIVQERLDRRRRAGERVRFLFSDAFPREIYRCLRGGCLLASAIDTSRVRRPGQKVEWVEMFGERRPILTGPLRIAWRCRAPALQCFLIPEPGFRYRAEFVELPLDQDGAAGEEEAVRDAAHLYARRLEEYLRKYPHLVSRI
jgi:lauroyl/myristoyl acyltransferase